MNINEEIVEDENGNKKSQKETKRQKQLIARKRIEDYIAEKQLRKRINDLDYGF